ncbi:hypothetical protein DL93DRAFT_2172021 [Clavulina sp. PMI_390]|nr:hypothetical protein DL93DRAFT_2172021 [Clavulina sp. PMI_390]
MPATSRSSSKPANNILSRREQAPPSTTLQSELPQTSSTAVTYQKRPSDQSGTLTIAFSVHSLVRFG